MSSPPTGTVTFLFTDIEGSTKLWERDRAIMSEALARHDRILRDAVEQRGGYVFKTVGDAFCAAFATAPDALEAAISVQHALTGDGRVATEPLRVRMALHIGSAEERGGDYFGTTLNRVGRLLSAGHGAQTLLSLPPASNECNSAAVHDLARWLCALQSLLHFRLRQSIPSGRVALHG